tara:strand:+ start:372 stop:746 length:375 start_codon:yes stop_codon:yes gene_type:complete
MTNRSRAKQRHGVTDYAWRKLREAERTLHLWGEMECNGQIQTHDDGRTHLYGLDRWGSYTIHRGQVPDREDLALKEARRIADRYGLLVYYQSDPRGCSLYVYRPEDLNGSPIDHVYPTQALAIC